MKRPLSVENRWDILYRDYPEVYDAFSNTPYHPRIYEKLAEVIELRDLRIADVGAGTGESTIALARYARQVIGIERETAMLRRARDKVGPNGSRAAYVLGDALALPLADRSVDLVAAITLALYPPEQYREFIREGLRAAGRVVYVSIPPGWYGGELAHVIDDPAEDLAVVDRIFLDEFHFASQDVFLTQEYGTVDHIVGTYGFIFGRRVIDYLKKEKKTSILWKFRIYSSSV